MRYRSIFSNNLRLLAVSGTAKYEFKNGVLTVGTATGTGAGNEIVPDLSGTNPDSKMQTLYPSGGTDLAKVGQGTLFIQAPPIIAAGTLTSGSYYEIISGHADLTDAAYATKFTAVLPLNYNGTKASTGFVLKATANITVPAASATQTATWALTPNPALLADQDHDFRPEMFKRLNLSTFKDESAFDPATKSSTTKDPKTVR